MEENRIVIDASAKEARPLPMGGKDSRGNSWQVDSLSFLKNGKRFLPVMGEFHYSRYEPEDWEEELYTTLAHEFTHHMEDTAGLHALDDKDAEFLRQAREAYGEGEP